MLSPYTTIKPQGCNFVSVMFWCEMFIVILLHVFIVMTKHGTHLFFYFYGITAAHLHILSEIMTSFPLCIYFVEKLWMVSLNVSSHGSLAASYPDSKQLSGPPTKFGSAHTYSTHTYQPAGRAQWEHSAEQPHTYTHIVFLSHTWRNISPSNVIHKVSLLIKAGIEAFYITTQCYYQYTMQHWSP